MTCSTWRGSRRGRSGSARNSSIWFKSCTGAIESARPLIESRQHKLTVAIVPETLPAEADPVRLEQIVTNLLTNAAKYTQNGGEIILSAAWEEDESIVIKVRDTGMGIPPEQISQMFELFAKGTARWRGRRVDSESG